MKISELLVWFYENWEVDKNIADATANKVDAVPGKGLSTEDYTTAEKAKLGELYTKTQIDVLVQNSKDFKYSVSTYGDLPSGNVTLGDTAWVKTASGVFLINRKPAGGYLYDGTKWVLSADYDNVVSELLKKADKTALDSKADAANVYTKTEADVKFTYKKTWWDYVIAKSVKEATANATITKYTYQDGSVLYRNRTESEDAFYSDYSLTILIAKR